MLACPDCRSYRLELRIFRKGRGKRSLDIEEGVIACARCRQWYPIIDSIPRMLPSYLREDYSDFISRNRDRIP